MISYINGDIHSLAPTSVVVETGGIGYAVNISLHTFSALKELRQTHLLIHTVIKEDSHKMYGFFDETERKMFLHLISVSGVGATTAQVVLSSLLPDEVRSAIVSEQDKVFTKIKGIGATTAKRIILDLKDKISKEGGSIIAIDDKTPDNKLQEDALAALVSLGYQRKNAQTALNNVAASNQPITKVDDLIRSALRMLA